MDHKQFDSLARSLHTGAPRRTALGLLLGGGLGLVGWAGGEGRGKGKGKGKGKKDKDKEFCKKKSAECRGKCGMGAACCSSFDCDGCAFLFCNRRDGSKTGTCGCLDETDEMFNGVCGTRPQCIPAGQQRNFFDIRCCSGIQHTVDPNAPNPIDVCDPGYLSCLSDSDCVGGSCRGFECAAPTLECPH